MPFGEQNNSFGRQIIPEMGQNKSFGIQNISYGRQNKSFGIQKKLLRETNKPSNGAIQIQTLGNVTENLLWETIFRYNVINSHNIAFNGNQSENYVDKTYAITRNIRQANHILAMYMIIELLKNKFILKSTNYFETNNASTKIVPRIDYKKGYSYRVSNQPKVSGCSENHRHSLSCLHSVIKYLIKMY